MSSSRRTFSVQVESMPCLPCRPYSLREHYQRAYQSRQEQSQRYEAHLYQQKIINLYFSKENRKSTAYV